MSYADHVRSYYEALNTGDAAAVSAHFTDDATHYTRLGPHEGAKTIGDMAALGVSTIDAQWYIENLIEADGEVAIEWTMTWRDPQGDLLGFDHEGRGYRMLTGWKAPVSKEAAA